MAVRRALGNLHRIFSFFDFFEKQKLRGGEIKEGGKNEKYPSLPPFNKRLIDASFTRNVKLPAFLKQSTPLVKSNQIKLNKTKSNQAKP